MSPFPNMLLSSPPIILLPVPESSSAMASDHISFPLYNLNSQYLVPACLHCLISWPFPPGTLTKERPSFLPPSELAVFWNSLSFMHAPLNFDGLPPLCSLKGQLSCPISVMLSLHPMEDDTACFTLVLYLYT